MAHKMLKYSGLSQTLLDIINIIRTNIHRKSFPEINSRLVEGVI